MTQNVAKEDVFPFFMMYNGGKLTVVALFVNADLTSPTGRFEKPPNFKLFWSTQFEETPKFLYDGSQSIAPTSMHIYFDERPLITNNCGKVPGFITDILGVGK